MAVSNVSTNWDSQNESYNQLMQKIYSEIEKLRVEIQDSRKLRSMEIEQVVNLTVHKTIERLKEEHFYGRI